MENRESPQDQRLPPKRRRVWKILFATILVFLIIIYLYLILPFWGIPFNAQRHTRVPITPAWALECWLWEDDHNTAARVDELLKGYAEHDIPVRTILLDSPWSTRYNDFIIDEKLYPNPEVWFKDKQDQGYRVVLWMTCMVDSQSKDTALTDSQDWFEEARQKGYIAGGGHQVKWWKGRGGFIDYTHPEAMAWWHGLQQKVFDLGIDGWKLDGADTLFRGKMGRIPILYQRTHSGWMTTRGYMDHYSRDEYAHGLTQNPEFITLVRSIDHPFVHPEGFAPLDAAPVTWVGDQRHAWKSGGEGSNKLENQDDLVMKGDEGIEEALRDILVSAERGYCVVGSDVAGFSGSEIPPRLYIRWAQFSAFCGLFLNGGHGDRALWKRSQEELEIIRKFSWLHTELIPYMYSHIVECHNGGKPLQRPVQGKYHYHFGDDFLVAPIYQDTVRNTVHLPKGEWRYLFDDKKAIEGPATLSRDFPLDEYPVYIREGAIIPMRITRDYTGIGGKDWERYLTLNIYPSGTTAFRVHHADGKGSMNVVVEDGNPLHVRLEGIAVPHLLRICLAKKPSRVFRDSQELQEGADWEYSVERDRLIVRCAEAQTGAYSIETGGKGPSVQ